MTTKISADSSFFLICTSCQVTLSDLQVVADLCHIIVHTLVMYIFDLTVLPSVLEKPLELTEISRSAEMRA